MIKRTLIAIAVVALLATMAQAAWVEDPFQAYPWDKVGNDYSALKVDGKDNVDIRWPYEINYKPLPICNIPIKMKVGLFVQINKCKDKKIVLVQKSCGDIGKGAENYPCYYGCVTFDVRANFEVKLGANLKDKSDIIGDWEAYYESGQIVPAGGGWHPATLCVKAWNTKLWNADTSVGEEIGVGSVDVTVKPNS